MKMRILWILAALLALGAAAAEGAELTFSSFDGGGHEYAVKIGDPALLACDESRDYGERQEAEASSAYTVTFAFTGLSPGSTRVAVEGRSPILENDDYLYTATVDGDLNVTLAPVREISTFFLARNGEIYYDSYAIARGEDGFLLSVSDGEPREIDDASAAALMDVVEKYGVEGWDGFDESMEYVLDGEGFTLEICLTDGTHILARGDNAFPENYFPAIGKMQEILENAACGGEETAMKLKINGTEVPVTWEENPSVAALRALAPLQIRMSMYGGFEQVGPIGQSLPREDRQTATKPGDIVLYAGDQIVVFYGENSWAYTRLGHVDLPAEDLAKLLSNGDVVIGIEGE